MLNIREPYLKCDGHQSAIRKRKTRIVVIDKWSDNVCGVVFACWSVAQCSVYLILLKTPFCPYPLSSHHTHAGFSNSAGAILSEIATETVNTIYTRNWYSILVEGTLRSSGISADLHDRRPR